MLKWNGGKEVVILVWLDGCSFIHTDSLLVFNVLDRRNDFLVNCSSHKSPRL